MNKQFVIKLMQAKQLQMEAFKEVMPEKMLERVEKIQDEMMEIGKEYVMTMMCQSEQHSGNTKKQGEKKSDSTNHGKAHKITIE